MTKTRFNLLVFFLGWNMQNKYYILETLEFENIAVLWRKCWWNRLGLAYVLLSSCLHNSLRYTPRAFAQKIFPVLQHLPVNFPWPRGLLTMLSVFAYKVTGNVPFLIARPPAIRQNIFPAPGLCAWNFCLSLGFQGEGVVRVGGEWDITLAPQKQSNR